MRGHRVQNKYTINFDKKIQEAMRTAKASPFGRGVCAADGEGKPGTKEHLHSDKHWLLIELSYRCVFVLSQHPCPLSRACARQLPQRGSPWQAGSLPTGRLRPDMAQKGGPCYRGQQLLDKRTLLSCRWPRQRSTTVSEILRFARPDESCPTRQRLPLWGSCHRR